MNRAIQLALCLVLLPGWAEAETRRFDFEVKRNGRPIGSHIVTVEKKGEETQVQVALDLTVTFGPFTLYRYTHRSAERWLRDRLQFVEATTDDDGTKYALRAWAAGGKVDLDGPGGRQTGTAETMPSSYWNPRLRQAATWIETHWGELQPIRIAKGEPVTLNLPGRTVKAIPHTITSEKAEVTPLYTEDGEWVGMTFELWGANFEYVMRATP
jgi:hypothetical protein